MAPTSTVEIDNALTRLTKSKEVWLDISAGKRVVLLQECLKDLMTLSEEWISQSCKGKGLERGSVGEGEEWVGSFSIVVRGIQLMIEALKSDGQPKVPSTRTRSDGQIVANVYPRNLLEKVMLANVTGEVWLEKGKPLTQGTIYRTSRNEQSGKISLVLGAGNQGSIGPLDMLYKLFVENEVVILKMNPVNEYLGPYIIRAFRALIEGNYLSVIFGGAEVGKYTCQHELVDSIHITGSCQTHDAIVWGTDKNKQEGTRQNTKPISSELGCVTPMVIVPGQWSEAELDFQARHIVSMVSHNASFNCNAGKVLVLPKNWNQRDQLLERIKHHFKQTPLRKSYYPGASERYHSFLKEYPNAIVLGEEHENVIPWTIFPDVPPEADEYALNVEAFCAVLAITNLDDYTDSTDYLLKAVDFCNERIWGTLSMTLLIDDNTKKSMGKTFDDAIAKLRYGGIGVNVWAGVVYGLVSTSWGAFPGHTLEDIISGQGVVHNALLIDHPEKSVVYAPFVMKPTPPWFADHKNLPGLGRALTKFESTQSLFNIPKLAINAFKG
jgi:hypothetical protein